MSIKIGNNSAFPYQGDYKPVNIYKGATKLAGWRWGSVTGLLLQFFTDYKDKIRVEIEGNSIQPLSFREEAGETLTLTEHEETSLRKLELHGDSEQTVTVQGRNMVPTSLSNWESGDYDLTTGEKNVDATRIRVPYLVKVQPNTTYHFNTFSGYSFVIISFNADGSFNTSWGGVTPTGTKTTSSTETYLGVALYKVGDIGTYAGFESDMNSGALKPLFQLNAETDKSSTSFVPNSPSPEYPSPIINVSNPELYSGATPMPADPSTIPLDVVTNNQYRTKPTLTAPLRKIGDVADRLFYDKLANKWKVERRVGEVIFNGTESWILGLSGSGWNRGLGTTPFYSYGTNRKSNGVSIATNLKTYVGSYLVVTNTEGYSSMFNGYETIRINTNRLVAETATDFKAWLSANPVTIYYELATPTIETLPDGTLPPLFKPTTYLDTIATLKGDIKAGYQLATTATPLETDIKVAPEYVNPIQSLDAVDVVSAPVYELDDIPDQYKTNLTLSTPLRKVGDVKDRLFRDSDGLWKVERKIWSEVLDGTKGLSTSGVAVYDGAISTNRWHTTLYEPKGSCSTKVSDCSHLSWVSAIWVHDNNGGSTAHTYKQFHLRIPNYLTGILNSDSTATRTTKMMAYIKAQYDNGTPIVIQYQLATPTLETLPQADQDKLNAIPTYRGDNYVYTVSNVEPSGIKADYKVRDI